MTLPTVTSGTLWAHYDASTIAGLSDGDALTTWSDLSGNSNNMAATSTGLKPVYDTDSDVPSGLPTVLVGQFREINDAWTGPAPATYFLLVKNPPDHGALHYIQGAFAPQMILWSTAGRWIFGTSTSGGQFIEFTDTNLPGEWCLWTFVWQNTGAILRANQSQRATGNITTVSATSGWEVGNANNSTTDTFHVAEIVIYDGVLDGTDIDAVEDYLHAKWLAADSGATVEPSALVATAHIATGVTGDALIQPSTVVGVAGIDTPTASGAALVEPSTVVGAAAVDTPSLTGAALVEPDALVGSAVIPNVSVAGAGDVEVEPATVQAAATIPTATAAGGASTTAATVVGSAAVPTPTFAIAGTATPGEIVGTVVVPTPTVRVDALITATAVAVAVSVGTNAYTASALIAASGLTVAGFIPESTVVASTGALGGPQSGSVSVSSQDGVVAGSGQAGATSSNSQSGSTVLTGVNG